MRVDGAVERVLSTIHEINNFHNLQNPKSSLQNFKQLIESVPPDCKAYLTLNGNSGEVTAETLEFPLTQTFIINEINILQKDAVVLNGAFIGQTFPSPSECQVKVWALDLLKEETFLKPLKYTIYNDGTLRFYSDELTVTHKILIQGCFDKLSVIFYGWIIDGKTDHRIMELREFWAKRGEHTFGRSPVNSSFLDVSQLDADYFCDQKIITNLKSEDNYTILKYLKCNHAETSSLRPSNSLNTNDDKEENDNLYFPNSLPFPPTEFKNSVDSIIQQLILNQENKEKLSVPDADFFLKFGMEIINILSIYEDEDICINDFLMNSTWANSMSLLLWPFGQESLYQNFLETFDAEKRPPYFDYSTATKNSYIKVFSILGSLFSTHRFLLSFFLSLNGLKNICSFLDFEIPAWSETYTQATSYPYKIQIAAFQLLTRISLCKEGVEALKEKIFEQDPYSVYECIVGTALKQKHFGRHNSSCLFNELCFNVRLYSVIQEVELNSYNISTSQLTEDNILGLAEALTCMIHMAQWDASREKEFYELGESLDENSLYSRVIRLSRVGSDRGLRNDGLGPDNHKSYLAILNNIYAKRFYRLSSYSCIPLILECKRLLLDQAEFKNNNEQTVQNQKANDLGYYYKIHSPVSHLYLLESRQSGRDLLSISLYEYPTNLLFQKLIQLIDAFLNWFLSTSFGSNYWLHNFEICDHFTSSKTITKNNYIDLLPSVLKRHIGSCKVSSTFMHNIIFSLDGNPIQAKLLKHGIKSLEPTQNFENVIIPDSLNLSFVELQQLQMFLAVESHVESFSIMYGSRLDIAELFGNILNTIAECQLKEEEKADDIKVNKTLPNESNVTYEQIHQEVMYLSTFCSFIEIMHTLLKKCPVSFIHTFFATWNEFTLKLCQLAMPNSSSDVGKDNFIESTYLWGYSDLSINAYNNDESENSQMKSGALSALVPSSLYTGIRQVAIYNQKLFIKIVDLLKMYKIISDLNKCIIINNDIEFELNPKDEFLENADKNEAEYTYLDKCVKLLVEKLRTLSNEVSPNSLIPTSESVEIAKSATKAVDSSVPIAPKLGAYNGTLGVPLLGLKWPNSTDSNNSNSTPPKIVPGWKCELDLCIKYLLYLINSSSKTYFGVNSSINEVDLLLYNTIVENPYLTFQDQHNVLKPALTQLLLTLNTLVSVPLQKMVASDAGRLEGLNFNLWSSVISEYLPICEELLHLTYNFLNAILPPAPYPINPIFLSQAINKNTSLSVSRYSSTDGTAWVYGGLIDTSLANALVLLATNLCQSYVIYHKDILSSILEKNINLIIHCLDVVSATLRMWALRAPDAVPIIILSIIRIGRLLPCYYPAVPFLLSAIYNFGTVVPPQGANYSFSKTQPNLITSELSGTEGRNLEAIISRLKQLYVQKRQAEEAKKSSIASKGENPKQVAAPRMVNRLPASMTTLTLSSRIWLPNIIEEALSCVNSPLYFVIQIPLSPAFHGDRTLCGSGGYEWSHRNNGRLTIGNEQNILSLSIFNINENPNLVQDWAVWERLQDLLHESLGDSSIELALESDRVPVAPLTLPPATMNLVTESKSQTIDFVQSVGAEPRRELSRLEKIARQSSQLKVEDISEILTLLTFGSFSSNSIFHASTAESLAIMTISYGPPILDLLVHAAQVALRNLSEFLTKELQNDRATGIARLFHLSRLLYFIYNTIDLIHVPMLETTIILLQLSAEALKAIQDVPVIDSECPIYPVLISLFDCLLPIAMRLFTKGIHLFWKFCYHLKQSHTHKAFVGLVDPPCQPDTVSDTHFHAKVPSQPLTVHQAYIQSQEPAAHAFSQFSNRLVFSQFQNTFNEKVLPVSQVSNCIKHIRSVCSITAAILNQLPIAWDCPIKTLDQANPFYTKNVDFVWNGLSINTVKTMLDCFKLIVSSNLLKTLATFDISGSFMENFFLVIKRLGDIYHSAPSSEEEQGQKEQDSNKSNKNTSTSEIHHLISNFTVNGAADLTIKLDSFIKTLIESTAEFADKKDQSQPQIEAFCSILDSVADIGLSLFKQPPIKSAQLLLSFITSETITPDNFNDNLQQTETQIDDVNTLYADLDEPKLELSDISNAPEQKNLKYTLLEPLINHISKFQEAQSCLLKFKQLEEIIQKDLSITSAPVTLKHESLLDAWLLDKYALLPDYLFDPAEFDADIKYNGLPVYAGRSFYGVTNPSTVASIQRLVKQIIQDPLWNNCCILDASELNSQCIPNAESDVIFKILQAYRLGEKYSVNTDQPVTNDESVLSPKSSTTSMHSSLEQLPKQYNTDSLRQRKTNISSRALSKHVDEFEAEQAASTKQPADFTASKEEPVDDVLSQQTLDSIPQWTEFVASGLQKGLDVMEILKNPQLLQNPDIETNFRNLVDLHPSIKELFKVMELTF